MRTARIAGTLLLCGAAATLGPSVCRRDPDRPPRPESAGDAPAMDAAVSRRTGSGETPVAADDLARDVAAFALDLHRELRRADGNLFYSPLAMSAALAMAYAGARGDTGTQMAGVLRYTLPRERLHPAFEDLAANLAEARREGRAELSTAYSVWPLRGYPLLEEYLSLLKRYYGTEVTPLRYRDAPEAARRTINRWVEQQTRGKVMDLIGPGVLDAETRLVLVSAIHFRAAWAHTFQRDLTREEPFHVSPEVSVPVPVMRQEGEFRYGDADGVQVLELPYRGNALSMLILLPREQDGLGRLEQDLSAEGLAQWRKLLGPEQVEVLLPRFTITATVRLDEALSALGMGDAFTAGRADFSGMDGRPRWLFLGAVLHSAHVDVNEAGTEAAAATAVSPPATAPGVPIVFRADRPFLFAIIERRTGALLFLGRLATPHG